MIRRPPRSSRTATLFPSTTLFRSDPPESLRLALRAQRLTGQIESLQLLVLARRDPDFGVNNVCLAAKGNEKIIAVHRPGVRRVSVDGHGQRMEDRKSTRLNSSH